MSYTVRLDNFTGPFDLLLRLIEKRQLDVCDVSLGQVTQEYLRSISSLELSIDEINWFLEIASKLILAKSYALLPQSIGEEDQEQIDELADQLMLLQGFQRAGRALAESAKNPLVLRASEPWRARAESYENLTVENISAALQTSLNNQVVSSPRPIRLKRQSLKSLQADLLQLWLAQPKLSLESLPELAGNNHKTVAFFTLVLEMIRQDKATINSATQEVELVV